ncbi:glycosyltransferase family 2 protein [Monashia sp. NPDC004114]
MSQRRIAVVTIVHGRHMHLRRQLWGLRRQHRAPDVHVVVAMDDSDVPGIVAADPCAPETHVPSITRRDGRLPLAAARNLGVARALDAGAEYLVLLDVDCIPSPTLVRRYAAVLDERAAGRDALSAPARPDTDESRAAPCVLAGEVLYLPPPPAGRDYRELDLDAVGSAHPARPILAADEVRPAEDLRLFWSLSFALTSRTWSATGGFDDGYLGYGGEDTDFGQRLGRAGGRMLWVGGAVAFHQHHPTSRPPVEHAPDIVSNANRFAQRWGWWPMESWLEAFRERGIARKRSDGSWETTLGAEASSDRVQRSVLGMGDASAAAIEGESL